MLQNLTVDSFLSSNDCHFLNYFLGLERSWQLTLAKVESFSPFYFRQKIWWCEKAWQWTIIPRDRVSLARIRKRGIKERYDQLSWRFHRSIKLYWGLLSSLFYWHRAKSGQSSQNWRNPEMLLEKRMWRGRRFSRAFQKQKIQGRIQS
jgi:hypothetical protein